MGESEVWRWCCPGGWAFLLVGVLLLAGCDLGPDPAEASRPQEPAAEQSIEGGLREDREPVRVRFPELGEFSSVVWKGEVLGGGSSRVPGPTDVRMSGVVRLSDADAVRLREGYEWRDASAEPVVLSAVRPRVPPDAEWQTSVDFTADVTGARYSGSFYADFERRVIVFDAVNPEKKA